MTTQQRIQMSNIAVKKIKVLKKTEHSDVGAQTEDEKEPAPPTLTFFNDYSGCGIDPDQEEQNQNVDRDQGHVEITTGYQEQYPPASVR